MDADHEKVPCQACDLRILAHTARCQMGLCGRCYDDFHHFMEAKRDGKFRPVFRGRISRRVFGIHIMYWPPYDRREVRERMKTLVTTTPIQPPR